MTAVRRGARPRAIFFDMDDTLISAYGRPEEAWSRTVAAYGDLPTGLDRSTLVATVLQAARDFWADPVDHRHWRQNLFEARRIVVRRAFSALGHAEPDMADRLADHFSRTREAEYRLFPGAHETLERLRAEGFRLALVTNGAAAPQRAKIERFALAPRFDHVLIEGELGYGKPEPQVYSELLRRCEVGAEEAWIVGDNLEWEVAAPKRHGIGTVWADMHKVGLPDNRPADPDHVITNLPELLARLGL
ncbi:MAG: HAD family hydrolase [Alphaproteobacteria bacterium]|nr:HAD family hydrolase [Alphaproteobacteria bacterium]